MPTKEDFIKKEIWISSFSAAFQRNSVYKPNARVDDKKAFKEDIKSHLINHIIPYYNENISDDQHASFLISVIDISKKHKSILKNDKISVGTAQKLLNLVLKYHWCLGFINQPPHFPVDSIIQKELPYKERKAWTKIDNIEDYLSVIESAKKQLKDGETLAEWELKNFNRN